jgi:hypothetical protein
MGHVEKIEDTLSSSVHLLRLSQLFLPLFTVC